MVPHLLKPACVEGGQGERGALPAPRVVRTSAPLVAAAVVHVDVVVVAVVVEHDGLRLSASRNNVLLPGIW